MCERLWGDVPTATGQLASSSANPAKRKDKDGDGDGAGDGDEDDEDGDEDGDGDGPSAKKQKVKETPRREALHALAGISKSLEIQALASQTLAESRVKRDAFEQERFKEGHGEPGYWMRKALALLDNQHRNQPILVTRELFVLWRQEAVAMQFALMSKSQRVFFLKDTVDRLVPKAAPPSAQRAPAAPMGLFVDDDETQDDW